MDGSVLVSLPPTLTPEGVQGQDDPYTWERAPGSTVWFPLGDGLSKEPPRLLLTGEHVYDTEVQARQHREAITWALGSAAELTLTGQVVASLRRDVPGHYTWTPGSAARQFTHRLVLNLTTPARF